MDQNQPIVDSDLQKAIDDITNTTSTDPVFSDPVAAPSSVPEGDSGELGEPVGPFPEPKPEVPVPPAPEAMNMPIPGQAPDLAQAPAPEAALGAKEIRAAALRDLAPLLDKVQIDINEKFNIYKNILEENKDTSILEPAYRTAKELPDDTARANALLYLVETIDKM